MNFKTILESILNEKAEWIKISDGVETFKFFKTGNKSFDGKQDEYQYDPDGYKSLFTFYTKEKNPKKILNDFKDQWTYGDYR